MREFHDSLRRRVLTGLGFVIALAGASGAAWGADSGGYRGPGRNGVFNETGLMTQWPAEGPMLVWRYGNLGNSWAAVTVTDDTVYAVGGGNVGRLFAFTLDGRLKWRKRYGTEFSVRYQGARATPTVSGPHVIVASGRGVVYCMDAETGDIKWTVDTAERFKNQVPGWGYNISPLVVGDKVILPIRRGTSTAVALDVRTGETVWANEPSEYAVGDSSPVLVEHAKTRLVVNNLWHALVALDPDTGQIVWKREGKDQAGTTLTPVFNEGYLLVDYGGKAVMLRPTPDGKGFEELWQADRLDPIAQAVILDGKVFAFGGFEESYVDDRNERRTRRVNAYKCYDARTGKLIKAVACKGAAGSVVAADGMIYWLEEGPRVSLARVTADGFEMVSSFEPEVGDKEMWIHPVIAQGRLFVRSDCAQGGDYAKAAGKLAVYDLRAGQEAELRAQRGKIEALVKSLKSRRAAARADAAEELLKMGWKARPAVPALAEALTDPQAEVRRRAAAALAEIGPEAIPALIRSLRNERVWSESFAADALVKATPGAADLTGGLIDAAEASPAVRDDAAAILARIGPAAAPALDKLLRSDDRIVRWWAIDVLKGYGPGAKVAVPNLVYILNTGDQWFRANAARALAEIGPDARDAVPALLELVKHPFADARAGAAEALGAIGEKSGPILASLRTASKDKDDKVAASAAEALKKLQQ